MVAPAKAKKKVTRIGVRSYDGEERRSFRKRRMYERHKLAVDANCHAIVSTPTSQFQSPLIDIAQNSCSFFSDASIGPGTGVHLQLVIFGGSVVADGQVVTAIQRNNMNRYGVLFEKDIPAESLALFERQHDRRSARHVHDHADGFARRLQEWKANEFYHYHRSDAAAGIDQVISFTTNDYLGLSKDRRILDAAAAAINEHGLGTAGPSIFAGDLAYHDQLSEAIASFKGMEACLLCPSGFTANSGLFTGLIQKKGTLIFLDEKDHASIFHGAMACNGSIKVFRHNDMKDLQRKLSVYDKNVAKVIFVDGVYSMDGDLAPLNQLHRLAKEYQASLWVDDAHSFGVFGDDGSGVESHFGLRGEIDIVTGSLSKALGAFGGFVCAKKSVIEFLDHLGREFVYTTTLPSAVCAGVIEGLKIVRYESAASRKKLWDNVHFFKKHLSEAGFPLGQTESPIIPVIFGHETLTQRFARALYDEQIHVNAVTRPAVRRNYARLRLGVRADHTEEQLARTVETMVKIGRQLGLSLDS